MTSGELGLKSGALKSLSCVSAKQISYQDYEASCTQVQLNTVQLCSGTFSVRAHPPYSGIFLYMQKFYL